MTTKTDGGPAFPHDVRMVVGANYTPKAFGGMSLRDYFAAAALTGILANSAWTNRPDRTDGAEEAAAFAHADLMLAQREKP